MSQVCDSQCDCLPSPEVPYCADELRCEPFYSVVAGEYWVSQGFELGPLMFIVFVNYLTLQSEQTSCTSTSESE